jgi:hypothetical protein
VTNVRSERFRGNVGIKVGFLDLLSDYFAVAIRIVSLQVVQKAAALTDQLQQSTPGSVIFFMRLEVFGQFSDTRTQNCDLDLRRAGVRIVGAEAFNQGCFLSSRQHGVCYSSCVLSPLSSVLSEITMNARPGAIRQHNRARTETSLESKSGSGAGPEAQILSARAKTEEPVVE